MKVDHCPSYLTRPCVIIMMTLTANQSVKKVPKIWPPTNPPYTHSCQLRLLCKTQGRDEWTHPPSKSNLTNTELWMSENNLQLSITWKWLVGHFHATVKIVCSPNSLEALKVGVLNAKFVPLSVLGSFALQKKKKKQRGKYFLINRDLKRKPQERNSQCCASKIQEKGKVCI